MPLRAAERIHHWVGASRPAARIIRPVIVLLVSSLGYLALVANACDHRANHSPTCSLVMTSGMIVGGSDKCDSWTATLPDYVQILQLTRFKGNGAKIVVVCKVLLAATSALNWATDTS